MKKPHIKKKAFTLTELLVVVIVIGVLSAVVLPKFSKVLETRKTTEAEELMSAVRTEQEKRCALDQKYTGSFKVLGQSESDSPKLESKYYTYALKQGGLEAVSKGKTYTLELESYKDGRFCCSGAYCGSLNKDYPSCEALKGEGDYQRAEGTCLASLCEVARQCNPGETSTKSCECGSQSRSCDGNCQWGSYTGGCYNKYGGTGATRGCASGCGTQTSVSTCGGESWEGSCWSPSGGRTETKSCEELQSNLRGTARRTCSGTCSGSPSCPGWDTSGCSVCGAPSGEASSRSCPSGYTGTQTRTWNTDTCTWGEWNGACVPDKKECSGSSTQVCGCENRGTQSRTCDTSTGTWSAWSRCSVSECECTSGQKASCNYCGTKTCVRGYWGNCVGNGRYSAGHDNYCLDDGTCMYCGPGGWWDDNLGQCAGYTTTWPVSGTPCNGVRS